MDPSTANFVGVLIGLSCYGTSKTPHLHVDLSILTFPVLFILGVVTTLFFQCMDALFDPTHRKGEGIKWVVTSYTVVMFSVVTVFTVMSLGGQIPEFRDWIGNAPVIPSFPPIPNIMLLLNYWLADGLLVSPSFDAAFTHLAV